MSLEIKPIGNDTEEDRLLNKHFVSEIFEQYVEIGKHKFVLPNLYDEKMAQEYLDFEVLDDDVFFVNHPKTGSTWLQELVWLINSDLDYDSVAKLGTKRFIFLESKVVTLQLGAKKPNMNENLNLILANREKGDGPRYIKSHMHWSMLPKEIQDGTKTPKIFIILRNPLDACVSFYHYSRMTFKYTGTFDEYCQLFMAGRTPWGPYAEQVLSCWEQRHRPNVCIVRYREMKADFPAEIRKVAKFLNKSLTDAEVDKLADFLSFENMKANSAINHEETIEFIFSKLNMVVERTPFVRAGVEGGYKSIMSPEMTKKFEEWVEENLTKKGVVF